MILLDKVISVDSYYITVMRKASELLKDKLDLTFEMLTSLTQKCKVYYGLIRGKESKSWLVRSLKCHYTNVQLQFKIFLYLPIHKISVWYLLHALFNYKLTANCNENDII